MYFIPSQQWKEVVEAVRNILDKRTLRIPFYQDAIFLWKDMGSRNPDSIPDNDWYVVTDAVTTMLEERNLRPAMIKQSHLAVCLSLQKKL